LKKDVCRKLAEHLELKHINSASLLLKEIEDENSTIGKQLKSVYNDLDYVDDNIVTDLVLKILQTQDKYVPFDALKNVSKGWILDGFPRTYNQAQLLQISGYIPDRVILLSEDRNTCFNNLVRKYIETKKFSNIQASNHADIKLRN